MLIQCIVTAAATSEQNLYLRETWFFNRKVAQQCVDLGQMRILQK
jgi:hypothetical protein